MLFCLKLVNSSHRVMLPLEINC
uniref:Uncharacterized protein n=1 Tax=Salix viminalis TaxID=40686 RepID=A0A6N2KQM7_SALVM